MYHVDTWPERHQAYRKYAKIRWSQPCYLKLSITVFFDFVFIIFFHWLNKTTDIKTAQALLYFSFF